MLSQGGIARQVAKPKPVAAPPAAVAKAPAKVAAPATKAAGVAPSASSGELKSLQEENQRLQGQVREQGYWSMHKGVAIPFRLRSSKSLFKAWKQRETSTLESCEISKLFVSRARMILSLSRS